MILLRPAGERGHFDHGWLDTWHTFSFAGYRDERYRGFRSLRVINEDRVAPGAGFDTHPHHDMEIITVVLSGALQHRDSLGHGAVIQPDEVQTMTAGTGLEHSEFNPSAAEPVHLLQIWLFPAQRGLPPRYDQRQFPAAGRRDRWQLLASPDGAEQSLVIAQDARLYRATLAAGRSLGHDLAPGRGAWVQVISGQLRLDEQPAAAGDGVAVFEQPSLTVYAEEPSDVLLFDLA